MYAIYYYPSHDAPAQLLHDGFSNDDDDKVVDGTVTQIKQGVSTMNIDVHMMHPHYGQIEAINGLLKVVNQIDDEMEFFGRVINTDSVMTSDNTYYQQVEAEDFRGYFHDSTQPHQIITNNGALDLFTKIITNHNAGVEAHKRFKVGQVTVEAPSDTPRRYIGYESTFDTIDNLLLKQIGGVIRLRHETDGMYVDWLEDYGDHIDSPIMIGENMLNASRAIDLSEVITRLVPVGADLDSDNPYPDDKEIIRPRHTISGVNGGLDYLDDATLIEYFGVIEKVVSWPEIDDPQTLKDRGQQYLDNQQVMLSSWEVETVEQWLLDDRFKKFRVGNWHPIINQRIGGIEELQIVRKTFSLVDYRTAKLEVGTLARTLSIYQLQMQEARRSIDRVKQDLGNSSQRIRSEINSLNLLLSDTADAQSVADFMARIDALETQLTPEEGA